MFKVIRCFALLAVVAGSLLLGSFTMLAQPTISIILVDPDVRDRSIPVDGTIREIKIAAYVTPANVSIQWTKSSASGAFDGETTGLACIYVLPQSLADPSEIMTITATVTDNDGNIAQTGVTFTLEAAQDSSPTATPTFTPTQPIVRPTPTSTPPPKVEPTITPSPTLTVKPTILPIVTPSPTPLSRSEVTRLLNQAEECLKKQRLTTPDHDNAFDCYQKVLLLEPANQEARRGVYAIAHKYKEWGDDYYPTNFQQARTYYDHYLQVAEYLLNTFGDETLRSEYEEVKRRLMATPTPTRTLPPLQTVTPTSRPTLPPIPSPTPDTFSCPPQTTGLDELLRILPHDLEQYKSLTNREKQGEQLNIEIITAIERIICDLRAIEKILEESYKQHPDAEVKERIGKTRVTRQQYEKERESRL